MFLEILPEIGKGIGEKAVEEGSTQAAALLSNPLVLVAGIVLIIAAVLIIVFLKRIILNSILGIIAWAVLTYVFKVELPFIASIAVSIVFGLAGIGAMLVLKFLGVF